MNLISFLGKRFKRFFSSGQKIPTSKFRWLALVGLLCVMPWNGAKAIDGCSWESYSNLDEITWIPDRGVIHYKIRACQTWGGTGNARCAWGGESKRRPLTLTQKTSTVRTIKIKCDEDYNNSGSSLGGNNLSYKKTTESAPNAQGGSSETTYFYEFDVPVEQNDLGKTIYIDLDGYWWKKGGTGWGVDEEYTKTNWRSVVLTEPTGPGLAITKAYYDCDSDKPVISFAWTRSKSDGVASIGTVYLCQDQSGSDGYDPELPGVTSMAAGNSPENFMVNVADRTPSHNLNKTYKYWLKQDCSYSVSANNITTQLHYVFKSSTYTVNAYPPVSEFTYESKPDDLRLFVKWRINEAPSSNYDDSPFLLTMQKYVGGKMVESKENVEIKYQTGKTEYSHEVVLPKDEEAIYKFFIERSSTKDLPCYSKIRKELETDVISTKHFYPKDFKANLVDGVVRVSWLSDGVIWSEGTKFVIIRTDSTSRSVFEKELTKDLAYKMEYIDDMVIPCHRYTYKVRLTPGGKYEEKELSAKDEILPVKDGNLTDIEISKGYYSDKVDLSWKTTSGYDEFVVERREYNNEESSFSKIKSIDASSGLTDFLFEDRTSQPGVVYEYRVYALFDCDGTIKSSTDTLVGYGFRTPTGDFTGRVTFANGQSVDSVEVRLETEDEISMQALSFNGEGAAYISGAKVLKSGIPLTMQAWIKPNTITSDTMSLINKSDFFELGLVNGSVFVRAGDVSLVTEAKIDTSKYTHVTAVVSDTSFLVYLDGKLNQQKSLPFIYSIPSSDKVVLGKNYKGILDELRLWSRILDANEIVRDYSRYLTGNEDGLDAYYTFDFMPVDEFYDRSFKGTSSYNGNTGKLEEVDKIKSGLSYNELSYKSFTNADGMYSVLSVPYFGNGTSYTLTPRKGIHQFLPTQEVRFISSTEQSHTVNFTDNSSFDLEGIIVYKGGTYPVEGVHFTIDGVPAMDKSGQYILSGADGRYKISVPVGIHEVRAEKDGHGFEFGGRVCNSDGSDRNYQGNEHADLYDTTRVMYVGRVCGGTVQEAFPVGFSLSKNNLAKDMKVILTSTQKASSLQTVGHTDTTMHIVSSNSGKIKDVKKFVSDYNEKDITIHVDDETGEFVAWVYPIEYNVSLSVYGHQDIAGDNSSLNLSNYSPSQVEKYEYKDTVFVNGESKVVSCVDSFKYRQKQVFTKRYRATMEVTPLAQSGASLDYFGAKNFVSTNLKGETFNVPLYDDATKSYTFGLPVFVTGETYKMRYDVFEVYPYYLDSKLHVDSSRIDRVEVEGVSVSFNNKLGRTLSLDSIKRIYEFQTGEPDLTTAKGKISATFTYGDSDNPTSVPWENPLGNIYGEAYVLGTHTTGTDFVTAGPDRILTVLRDPPGSNSYSYLEKGTSFSESSTYTGSISQEGTESWTTGFSTRTISFAGTGGIGLVSGTAQTVIDTETGFTLGIEHSESYTGSNSKTTNITTTERFQTSDDPSYVGADADLYVGYSTNVTFGTTLDVKALDRKLYDELGSDYYEETFKLTDKYAIVKDKGFSVGCDFKTLFAYTQAHVEKVLIPNLENLRNSLLILPNQMTKDEAQEKANKSKRALYLSKVNADNDNFAKEDFYEFIKPEGVTVSDSVEYLNESIKKWSDALEDNEKAKVSATKLHQNYSFQGGSNIEYSEAYSSALSSTHGFDLTIGGLWSDDGESKIFGATVKFSFEEHVATTQSGEFSGEAEVSHSKGFVLAEDGSDYLSVDVFYEELPDSISKELYDGSVGSGSVNDSTLTDLSKDLKRYPSFIFKTRGGATSCPYEGVYETQHYEKGKHVINVATKRMEVPKINILKDFVENVPSGEPAFFTVRMMNESETGDDQVFDLRLLDASNPNGAVPTIDGNSMSGTTLSYEVPAGGVLEKTLAVYKGSVLNYDSLKLVLSSQCQSEIADTVDFSVHFIPSCSNVAIAKPSNNWTYNTNCATDSIDGVVKHYMPITISGFDVNYTDFEHIELQYKPASGSDNDWVALSYYYKDSVLAQKAVDNGFNAFVISSEDGGNLYYNFYMDNLPDQRYDIRAVSFCNINNQLYENPSEIVSGVKDMYNPRLFGTPKPADGVLSIEDDVRIDFNETIAEGMLTPFNFEVIGVRNGAVTDHSVAIALDGENDYLTTEATRNFANKDLTFECWVNYDSLQNATFFSQGDANEAISMGMNDSGKVVVKVADKVLVSEKTPAWEKSSWNHVALVYDNTDTTVTAYVNYTAAISGYKVNAYTGNGVVEVGRDVATQSGNFNGKVDQFRIWNDVRSSATIQANSTAQLSGNDLNLIAYYEMEEAKGSATEDKARGANLVMKGGSWALPEGRSAEFDGASYVAMNSSAAVITSDMDFTLEFWFNAVAGAKDQTILSNGNGIDKNGENPSKVFSVGFDEEGTITFRHNGYTVPVNGKYADNNWHNFTLAVNRSSGNARIYMDGELNTYFPAEKVGRIASDKLFAGARVWSAGDSTIKTVDQYFTGKVDEVRLWNLYRQQSQIEKFYNQKSNGDEMGLLLYYPFEHYIDWQGTAEMQFTLDDKGNDALDGSGNKLAFATTEGNVVESKNIPPVKTKGATASLLYDWVVNNDALIITLKEQDYRIEKTIVNFTVNKVQDVNGNYILSPITWSAYIDRNQLKWMDDAVTVNKKQNEAYEFEMPIVNKGGSIINYSLDNMPSWLSASSESGVINPLEKQTIKFEIDPSLAVGTYDEVVYLTNSNNVTEPLALNVTVEGNTPDWKVDPSKYEFSMAVFAQIKVDNQFSNDEKDMLAAFYEDECVGVAHMSYDKTLDMWYALLTVYSEKSSTHELTYRIWDASTGRMYKAVSSPTVKFVNNKVSGKPTEPIVFSNSERVKYQNILLNKGWNWVSFNLKSGNISNMDTYLKGGNWTANSFVKSINKSANYSPENAKWTNSGVRLNNVNMFKIYSDVEQTLAVSGSDLDLSSTEISLKKKGWTYIAYLPTYSMTLKAALADYEATEGDVIKSKEGFAMYYGNEWIGSLKSLQPNSGYMMKNMGGEVKKFKYPTASTALRSAAVVAEKASAYESNMSVIAYAPEKKEGDVLRVLVGNEENEVVEVALTDDYALQFINVSANAGDKVRFTMERDGVTYVANNSMSFAGDAVYGTPSEPYILNFNIDAAESLSVYPNPVVDLLNVSGALNGESEVTLELFDLAGALVYTKQVSVSDNALDASISMNGFAAGSYLLKVSQNGDSKMFKIVKK